MKPKTMLIILILLAVVGHGAVLLHYHYYGAKQISDHHYGHEMQEREIRKDTALIQGKLMDLSRLYLSVSMLILNKNAIVFYNEINSVPDLTEAIDNGEIQIKGDQGHGEVF